MYSMFSVKPSSFVLAFLALSAQAAPKPTTVAIPVPLAKEIVARYSQIVLAAYADTLATAKELQSKLQSLVKTPTPENLLQAKTAWRGARDAYARTETFRFYGGPIDDPKDGPEGFMNAWPIDEVYLDYVKDSPQGGVINNPKDYPQITKELLLSLNEKNGEKNISTGFHAIEFLLWGQDLSGVGPGNRPVSDYDPKAHPSAARRGQYLNLLGDLLVEHATQVFKAWDAANGGAYPALLQSEALDESLRKIYTGMVNLSIDEMAGERMTVALEKNDQENEQDCFSDYTLHDAMSNQLGIANVYFGRIGSEEKSGVRDLIAAIDPKLEKIATAKINTSLATLKALADKSFDQIILGKNQHPDRKKARSAIAQLEDQARSLAKSGLKMGLVLNIQ